MNKYITLSLIGGLIFINANAYAESGKLQICRRPGIIGLMDGKKVDIPADTYTGSCDKNGEHCRSVVVKGEAAVLKASKSSCVTVNAEITEPDGKPIKKGYELLPQWSIAGFEPIIKAATDFK